MHLVCKKKVKDDLAARSLQGIDAVIDDILSDGKLETIIEKLMSVPKSERWHIDIETQATVSPRSLVYWFASHWTSEFIESYVRWRYFGFRHLVRLNCGLIPCSILTAITIMIIVLWNGIQYRQMKRQLEIQNEQIKLNFFQDYANRVSQFF